jgi:5-methylcytosine-specific restriction endonuclease McrA
MPFAPPKHRPSGWRPRPPKPTDQFYKSPAWLSLRQKVIRRARGRCVMCGAPGATQVDHRIPRSLGGADALWNLRLLCRPCDNRRHAEKGADPES